MPSFSQFFPKLEVIPNLCCIKLSTKVRGQAVPLTPYSENILFQLLTLAHKIILQSQTLPWLLEALSCVLLLYNKCVLLLVICPITNGSLPCKQLSVVLVIRPITMCNKLIPLLVLLRPTAVQWKCTTTCHALALLAPLLVGTCVTLCSWSIV